MDDKILGPNVEHGVDGHPGVVQQRKSTSATGFGKFACPFCCAFPEASLASQTCNNGAKDIKHVKFVCFSLGKCEPCFSRGELTTGLLP
jgi:hypothetical protein